MENVVTVSFEVAKDSDLYKSAVEFSEKHNSVGIFSTPEKVLEYCTTFGISMHILRNMEFLGDVAEKQKAESRKQKAEKHLSSSVITSPSVTLCNAF